MEPALTLTNAPLDLQITICMFLRPSDILALRKTCKALELVTRRRIVWVAALHRVCSDNTLFLPSFPIPDMTYLELERAAVAPGRWIGICNAFQKQHSKEFSEMIHPRSIRIIEDAYRSYLYIVPGGRYLVTAGNGLFVWDLGYVSTVECKLVASAGLGDNFEFCVVQATPDGKGLVILSSSRIHHVSIFEIYPQSEMPLLTQIAHLDQASTGECPTHYLLPDTLICHVALKDRIVFRVVDYRTNYSTRFSVDIDTEKFESEDEVVIKTFATKTAIFILCREGILIWAIPPLSPQLSDLGHILENNSIHTIPPLLKIPFQDGVVRPISIRRWITLSSWYFESWKSFYFDILYTDSKLQRFKIILEPDLSDAILHIINMSEVILDVNNSLAAYMFCEGYRICEDVLVHFWRNRRTWGAHTGLRSAPFTNAVTRWKGCMDSLCPTSGRCVYRIGDGDRIVVVDLL